MYNQIISIIISILRTTATIGIFVFHILGLYGLPNKKIDFISILIFCFISGYLIKGVKKTPAKWLKKRFLSILIPYWFVIIPALTINFMTGYKKIGLEEYVITLIGGNLFIENPVYVIAWYITFILLLYMFTFAMFYRSNCCIKVLVFFLGSWFFGIFLRMPHYFLIFCLGILLNMLFPMNIDSSRSISFNRKIFAIQKYCYPFFLIHGGVLLFFHTILESNFYVSVVFGLIFSTLGAIILFHVSQVVLKKLLTV